MNIYKIRATIYRDLREFLTNYAVLTLLFMPPVMAFLYRFAAQNADADMPLVMIFVVIGTALSSIATNVPLMLYAEENEHGLLKFVTHTKADLVNGMIGRSILTLIITAVVGVISLLIMNGMYILTVPQIIGIILAMIIFLNLGLWTGLLAKLQSTSTVYGVIILFFLGMTPIIETLTLSDNNLLVEIFGFTPVYQLIAIYNNGGITPHVILLIWLVLTTILVWIAARKRSETL